MEIILLIVWLIFSIIVGSIGSGRNIGFLAAFCISLLFSPVIGLIFTLISKNKSDEAYKEKILKAHQSQQDALKKIAESENQKTISIADEIQKLNKLKSDNLLTEEEYQSLRKKLIE